MNKQAVFRCPKCGTTTVGPREWANWCTAHEVTATPDGGLERRLVQMVIDDAQDGDA